MIKKQLKFFNDIITFREFSKSILESGDIDPDYIYLRKKSAELELSKEQLFDWILLKLCVYNSVSELKILLGESDFENVKYGNERNKHKNQAREYYNNIRAVFPTEESIIAFFNRPAQIVFNSIKDIRGFGPWSAWKFMDLISCVYGLDVDFEGIDFRKSYEFPLKGLLMVNDLPEDIKLLKDSDTYDNCMMGVYEQLNELELKEIPHNNNKGVRLNEIETLLCKYHSYRHGHYYPGKDLEHLNKAIENG